MKKDVMALVIVLVVGFISFVAAQVIMNILVVNSTSCFETDSGLDYLNRGSMSGSFWWNSSNGTVTYNGTFIDTCLTNSSYVLLEVVCGSSINANLNNLAAIVNVDCRIVNGTNGTCVAGRCA